MKKNLFKNMFVVIAALFIASFTLPAQAEDYPIEIADIQLTSDDDLTDIKFDEIVSGKVSYDPKTRTLTLENAVINAGNFFTIVVADKDKSNEYTIMLKGKNRLTSDSDVLNLLSPVTITGDGSLEIISKESCGIYVNLTSLTIKGGCSITSLGKWGIAGSYKNAETLKIDNANVKAKGGTGDSRYGSIRDFKEIKLNNCKITEPADATIDGGNVMLNGDICTEEVVITSTVSGIETATVTTASAKHGTYTISGVKTETDFEKLPKGMYIVDGIVKAKK